MNRSTRLAGWRSLALAIAAVVTGSVAAAEKTSPAVSKLDAPALAQKIDQAIQQRLDAEKLKPSQVADDAEFMRRAYLDITGVIPTVDQAAAFLDSKDASKRAKLIDELLASPQYGKHMADTWASQLLPRNSDNRRLQSDPMSTWLKDNFNSNKPWNKLVSDLLTSSGTQDKNGAVTFFLANPTVDKVTDTVSRLFLGVQLQCAQCHNHPFTKWKQTEYWGMAAFFLKVQADNVNKAAKDGTNAGITEVANRRPNNKNKLPESAKLVNPKFFFGEEPKIDAREPFRPVLTNWLTSGDNPFFAKAMVNRLWSQFFGRGFVNPIDDMHDANIPSHPELLKELSQQFVAHDFDVKETIRAICNSQTYQRTSRPTVENDSDTALFSHMIIKSMTGEQMYDSLVQTIGTPSRTGPADRKGAAAGPKGANNNPRVAFVNFFNLDEGADPTEYQAGIPQVLRLMNSSQFNRSSALLDQVAGGGKPEQTAGQASQLAKLDAERIKQIEERTGRKLDAEKLKQLRDRRESSQNTPQEPSKKVETNIVERIYLGTLSRRPTVEEAKRMAEYVSKHESKAAYTDILWVLLNTSEFALNH